MLFLTTNLDNRELALLVWIIILLIISLINRNIRSSLFNVVKAYFQKKLFVLSTLMILYIIGFVYYFESIEVWNFSHLSETIVWFFGIAFVMFFNAPKAGEDDFFKNHLIENIKLVVLLEFVLNFFVFSFWFEIFFLPIMFFLWATLGYASSFEKYKEAEKFLQNILAIIGLGIIVYVIYRFIIDFHSLMTIDNLIPILIPIVFTLLLTPLIYVYALYIAYEMLYLRMSYIIHDDEVVSYAKKRSFQSFFLNLWGLKKWASNVHLSRPQTKEEVNDSIHFIKNNRA